MAQVKTEIPPELERRFRDRLRVFAARRSADPIAAESIAEETLQQVVRDMLEHRIESLESVPRHIFLAARERCDARAGKDRSDFGELAELVPMDAGDRDGFAALVDGGRIRQLCEALAQVGDTDRELLDKYYRQGLAVSAIGPGAGLGPGAVRQRKDRLLHQVGELLAEAEREAEESSEAAEDEATKVEPDAR